MFKIQISAKGIRGDSVFVTFCTIVKDFEYVGEKCPSTFFWVIYSEVTPTYRFSFSRSFVMCFLKASRQVRLLSILRSLFKVRFDLVILDLVN